MTTAYWLDDGRLLIPGDSGMVAVHASDPRHDRWLPHAAPIICDGPLCPDDRAPLQPEDDDDSWRCPWCDRIADVDGAVGGPAVVTWQPSGRT